MKTGETAENFSLIDQHGNNFILYENLDKMVLLVFYPHDNSPVCTRQLKNYNLNKAKFEKYGIRIIGVNPGSYSSHLSFCSSFGANIRILSDDKKDIAKRYYAINFLGITKRKIVLIGKDKKVLFQKTTPSFVYLKTSSILSSLKKLNII